MSLFRREIQGPTPEGQIPPRLPATRGSAVVNNETALRHSAVWACLRLRSNLISTMPVDAYREVGDVSIEVAKPRVLQSPGGDPIRVDIGEWLYSSQFDLDRAGNCFGLITERDGRGLPARIDLQPLSACSLRVRDGKLTYRIGNSDYQPDEVWHERQYTVAGLPVGLSPVAYAAWSIGEYLSIVDFALDWFSDGTVPKGHLRNTEKPTITEEQAATFKARFKHAVQGDGLFVTGKDWEYNFLQAEQAGAAWIDAKQYGVGDIARFFDCPGDLIDAAVKTGGNINYANQVQRNLQFLVMNLGPAVFRRERALSKLLPAPRFVKLNSGALLRMDPKTQAEMFEVQIRSRQRTANEARALLDMQPLTDAQLAEFDRLFPPKNPVPTGATA